MWTEYVITKLLKQKQCVESMKIKIDRNECYSKQGNNLCSVWDQTALQSVIYNIKAYIHYIPKTKIKTKNLHSH